jgi:hypothetical protein
MKVFGKPVAEYFAFQRGIVILIVVVGLVRLAMSLAGFPVSTVKWISLTAMALIGIIYCAVQVPRTGFGGYKHLLPLFFIQALTANLIIAGGIALAAITGRENIYSIPEYSGPLAANPWLHAAGHLLDGLIVGPLVGWLIGSAIMFVVKRLVPARAGASAAAGMR